MSTVAMILCLSVLGTTSVTLAFSTMLLKRRVRQLEDRIEDLENPL